VSVKVSKKIAPFQQARIDFPKLRVRCKKQFNWTPPKNIRSPATPKISDSLRLQLRNSNSATLVTRTLPFLTAKNTQFYVPKLYRGTQPFRCYRPHYVYFHEFQPPASWRYFYIFHTL